MKLKTTLIATAALALALPGQALAAPKAKLRFEAATYAAGEGQGVDVVVTRGQRNPKAKSFTGAAVSVNWSVSGGSATNGVDYTLGTTQGRLDFAAGEASKTIHIDFVQDTAPEAVETIDLTLSNASRGASITRPSTARVLIADNDGPTQFNLVPAAQSVSEADETADALIVRSGDVSGSSTVDYATADGDSDTASANAKQPGDYTSKSGSASFSANEFVEEVKVSLNDDSVIENSEAFKLVLSNPSSGSTFANGAPTVTAAITIVDNDSAPVFVIGLGQNGYVVNENGTVDVTILRLGSGSAPSAPNSSFSVTLTTADGTATSPADYLLSADDNVVDFDPTEDTQKITIGGAGAISVVDDALAEGNEAFTLGLSSPRVTDSTATGGATLGDPAAASVTIVDNDVAGPGGGSDGGAGGGTNVTNVTNVTNTTNVIGNPFGDEPGLLVLGERIGGCKLTVGAVKRQRIVRAKSVRVKLHAVEACTGSVKAHVKGRKSLRGGKKGAVQTKVVKFALKAGQTKTVKMTFSKRGLGLLKRALGKQRTLSAALLVRSVNPAKRVTLSTLRWKAKR